MPQPSEVPDRRDRTATSTPVTIVTPYYNTGPLLHETARSIFEQTFQQWEWIIVNDGSTDPQAMAALEPYRHGDPRIRIVSHPHNRGLSAARNTGVAACQTPYFLQLDADDLIAPTFLEKCLWALESHPEWAFCNTWSIGFGAKDYLWDRGFDWRAGFLAENHVVPAAVIRREADRSIGGHDEGIRGGLEDWDYWLKMAAHGYWGGTLPEYLIRYRHHHQPTYWPNRDDLQQRSEFRQRLRSRYPRLWQRGGFPQPTPHTDRSLPTALPFTNPCPKPAGQTRVLLVLPWLNLGGADRFNLSLVEQLAQRGYGLTVCATAPSHHPWLAEFARHTPDVFALPNFLTPERQPLFLRYVIESRQADVVFISHSMLGYSLLPYLRAHCPNTVFVDYNHMVVTQWMEGGFPRVGVNCQSQLDLNIVSSDHVKRWMVAHGADARRIEVCYTNIDPHEWDPARFDRLALQRAHHLAAEVPVILYPARLEPQKRPRLLVEILRRLREADLLFHCLIAGDGPQRGWLEAALRRHRLRDAVTVLGAVSPQQMPELMALSDILLLPSQEEGISLAIFEAMAMRLVTVSADVGGQRELVTPEVGRLILPGPGEVDEYVAVLSRLLQAPELRAQLGQAARERILAYFTIEQMAERMQGLFDQARRLARTDPRAGLDQAEAQRLAERVVEDIRYERLQENLRAQDPRPASVPDTGIVTRWRQVIYQLKKRAFRPAYYWALRHGMDWVVPLANWAYRRLRWLLK